MSATSRLAFSRLLVGGLVVCAVALPARATNPIYHQWKVRYPDTKTDDNVIAGVGVGCQTCHVAQDGHSPWNAYGWAVRTAIHQGNPLQTAFAMVEGLDSDNDPTGSTNLEEIQADSQPGWTSGPNNTFNYDTGQVLTNKLPPAAIQGFLDPVWTKLNSAALAGSAGLPNLKGVGTLKPDTPLALNTGDILPSSPFFLVVGLSELNAPFKGGVLVPSVSLLSALVSDASGFLSVQSTWPVGIPPGTHFWAQSWIQDPAGPKGFAASNGLMATAN